MPEVDAPSFDSDHDASSINRLNALRAAVLGADDGIVSVASIVLGVAGATSSRGTIFTAGLAGLVAGAMSMAVGEYVSVSSQRDTQKAFIAREEGHLKKYPEQEFEELQENYQAKGLTEKTAQEVARELSRRNVLKAHMEVEMGMVGKDLINPIPNTISSFLSFIIGGLIPLLAIILINQSIHLIVTVLAVLLALCITGYVSASFSGASRVRATMRVVLGGALAMLITYSIGHLFGTAVH